MEKRVSEIFPEEARRLINQSGVKAKMIEKEGNEEFNACWDGIVAPDGAFYYPLSSEGGASGTTNLAKYDFATNTVRVVLDGKKVLMPIDRQIPHSKFHTSLHPIPRHAVYPECPYDPDDYLIIGTTHMTDRARQHPAWLPFAFFDDVQEGYQGSQIVVFDPKNEHAFSMGIPVPRETIYGTEYDPKHNRLYMIGDLLGHVYCFDLAQRRVTKDLGKMSEITTYRLVLGSDGNIYGGTKSGQLFRVNTETNELENMDFHVPDFPENYISYTWYRWLTTAQNHPSGKYLYMAFAAIDTMYKLEFATGKVTPLGCFMPKDCPCKMPAKDASWHIRGFIIDNEGVLWIIVRGWSLHNETNYHIPFTMFLIRWDVDRGEEPFYCGLVGTPEYYQEGVSEMDYDPKNDILYWTNTTTNRPNTDNRPMAGGIDLKEFRKHYRERGPISEDPFLDVRELSAEEKKAIQEKLEARGGEQNAVGHPFAAFDALRMTPVRIWRSLPRLDVSNSKVMGMAFDREKTGENYLLHVVCGEKEPSYVLQIADGKVITCRKMEEISQEYRTWLQENVMPKPCVFDETIQLPEQTGRRYLAKATCAVDWNGDRQFVGTRDAMAAIVSKDRTVYSLGKAAPTGPIRAMVVNKEKTCLWGVAGDEEDLGYIFRYDDTNGLEQLGILNYDTYGYYDGPVAANVLSAITLSPDEAYLAVGSADRIAMVAIVKL